ncbi:juvenile hormone epoxide hydrolase-like [Maniola hyperantus]|uniref:juvenile hormone epoxide hydrolase-like n=1 Tax=Aphantopus hyperantus TaxID=2795564 RepID=UPI0015696058|nr:juvenile hormone epoxide hydrolase-like [Maniola hyperantus]
MPLKKNEARRKKSVSFEGDHEKITMTEILSKTVVAVVLLALLYHFYMYIYISIVAVPVLPKFDLNLWWGPNNTKVQDNSIRPYRIVLSDSMQENLRRKFESYRRAIRIKSFNESSEYGINSDVLGQIFAHWQFKYNYRERARYLNKYNHFKTNVQGLDIHFIRVKPDITDNVKVLPLLLLHGWPSSVKDFYDIIPLLTSPRPGHNFVFEIIAPSLPGFTYSQGAVRPGLTTYQIAIIMRNLMEKIGFKQFYIHGQDIGSTIGSHIATIFPKQVLGFHTSTPVNYSKLAQLTLIVGAIFPTYTAGDLADKVYPLKDKLNYFLEESGYLHLQSTKPDTVGIALQDSPLGLGAYIIEKYLLFTNPNNKNIQDGGLSTFNKTDLLDNVLMYWTTGSITTSLRLYKEVITSHDTEEALTRIPTPVPTWGLRTKYDLIHQPDFILRWKYPNLVGVTNVDVGGHFASFEKPNEVADDIYKAVKNFSSKTK